jgi:hypothetical protein
MILRKLSSFVPVVVVSFLAMAPPASAQVIELVARIDGAQETPPVATPGVGIGVFSVDTQTGNVDYRITFTGLTAPETMAHIHGFAFPGTPAGILFNLPTGSPKCGSFTLSLAQQGFFLAGMAYVNIHTTAHSAGEIRGQINEPEAHATFCYGDGSGTGCPCNNSSIVGENEGCLHSDGTGGRLVAYGNASLSSDTLVLHYLRGPDTAPVLFFQGTSQVLGGSGAPFGDGLRCVAGSVVRLGTRTPCGGQMAMPEPLEPPISSLSTFAGPGARYYQAWLRNAATFCTGDTFNLTNGVQVQWVP